MDVNLCWGFKLTISGVFGFRLLVVTLQAYFYTRHPKVVYFGNMSVSQFLATELHVVVASVSNSML